MYAKTPDGYERDPDQQYASSLLSNYTYAADSAGAYLAEGKDEVLRAAAERLRKAAAKEIVAISKWMASRLTTTTE